MYQEPLIFDTGSGIKSISIGDFDADGKLDIAAVNAIGSILILKNTSKIGGFTFNTDLRIPCDNSKNSWALSCVGDLNGDGKIELVVGNNNAVSIFQNTSNNMAINFAPVVFLPYISSGFLSICDFDGDGKPDLAGLPNSNSNDSWILRNLLNTPPITSFTPESGTEGTEITILGDNFTNASEVSIDGELIKSFTIVSPTIIKAKSGTGITGMGYITVKTPQGVGSSGKKFSHIPTITVAGKNTIAQGDSVLLSLPKNIYGLWLKNTSINAIGIGNSYMVTDTGTYTVIRGWGLPQSAPIKITYATNTPFIKSFSPATGPIGTSITIKGLKFANATNVSIGNVPVKSFNILSDSLITAIVDSGTVGGVSVTTPIGRGVSATKFVNAPIIEVEGGVTSMFPKNDGIYLSTKYYQNCTYQWHKNGKYLTPNLIFFTADTGFYEVVITYPILNPETKKFYSAKSNPVKLSYSNILPITNFQISTTSATCKNTTGLISIKAKRKLNYKATINIKGLDKQCTFTDSIVINNLTAATYKVFITVDEQSSYKQIYDLVISEPEDLSVYSTLSADNKNVSLSMAGGTVYNVQLNGFVHSTTNSQIILALADGKNDLVVTTDKPCQGIIKKTIINSGDIKPYPAPFDKTLNLYIGNQKINKAMVEVYTLDGSLVYKNLFINPDNILQLNLSALITGSYILKLKTENVERVFKILKK